MELTIQERMAALIDQHKNKIPDWAQWIAVDADGECCVYSACPFICDDVFTTRCEGRCDKILHLVSSSPLTINWRETLTELKPAQWTKEEVEEASKKASELIDKLCINKDEVNLDQQKMLERDEREMSQAEEDYEFKTQIEWYNDRLKKRGQGLTIPSTLPSEQAMPCMLGGEFGAQVYE